MHLRPQLAVAALASFSLLGLGSAVAHTNSVGYESAGGGNVTFWYGTYHAGTNFTEGSFSLNGVDVTYSSTVSFTVVTTTKPSGLVDGTNNFYSNGTTLVGTNPGSASVAWQGVTFTGLRPGTYTFQYVPIAVPTATWDPIDGVILSSSVTLSAALFGPVGFTPLAATGNQTAVAGALDRSATFGHPIYEALSQITEEEVRAGLNLLSGEVHASSASTALTEARLVQDALLHRLRGSAQAFPMSAGAAVAGAYAADMPGRQPAPVAIPVRPPKSDAFWGQGFGSWGETDSNGNAATVERTTGGFVLGADTSLGDRWRAGVAGGYTESHLDVADRLSSGQVRSVFGAAYGSAGFGELTLRAGAAAAHNTTETRRGVVIGTFSDANTADYDGHTLQAFGEVGYKVRVGAGSIEPFAAATALRVHTASFRESGAEAALMAGSLTYDLGSSTLGLRAEMPLMAGIPLVVRGMVGWRQAYGELSPEAVLAFQSAPESPFRVAGIPVDRTALAVEAGLDWQASDAVTLSVSYAGQVGSRAHDQALKGKLEVRF
ncbi:MAG TPA: autotransporter domain-containing protein [Microvirga sp.]|jgi:outer membrane autotransporter protein|nr:autotransporter domain-containing protein [Microvirga sp.]